MTANDLNNGVINIGLEKKAESRINQDLKQAYEFAMKEAKQDIPITPDFLQKLNGMLMRTTGSVHSTMAGLFD